MVPIDPIHRDAAVARPADDPLGNS